MKLRNLFICATAIALAACETIDEADRFGEPVLVEVKKNVLVEEFTGQTCVNCPTAAAAIADLQKTIFEAYSEQHVISVAIHGGSMAIDAPYGLATPLGQQYNTAWGIESWPSAVIDRVGAPNSDINSWNGDIIERLGEAPKAELSMQENSYDAASRTLSLKVDITAPEAVNGTLQVWLTESHIIGYQSMPGGGHNTQYEHNHILRDAVNGANGESIALAAGEALSKTYTYVLDATWKPEHMAVVAFVHNASGVLQVIEAEVITH